jgi:hypothetical protein
MKQPTLQTRIRSSNNILTKYIKLGKWKIKSFHNTGIHHLALLIGSRETEHWVSYTQTQAFSSLKLYFHGGRGERYRETVLNQVHYGGIRVLCERSRNLSSTEVMNTWMEHFFLRMS